jgi:hypothetical protein
MPDNRALNEEKEPSREIREIKYLNRREIWVKIDRRKRFSELELRNDTAF